MGLLSVVYSAWEPREPRHWWCPAVGPRPAASPAAACSRPSRGTSAHTWTFYCACAKLRMLAWYAASPAAACSRPSRGTSAHTQTFYCACAKLRNLAYYAASPEAACSRQSRRTSAHTDNLLRMRKVKKFSIVCCQPSGSLLSSVTRDICAQTQTFYCACAKLRNLAYYAASPAAACSRQSRGTSAHTHRHFTAHA